MKNPITTILAPVFQFLFSPIVAGWQRAVHEEQSKGALLYVKDVDLLMLHIEEIASTVCSKHIDDLRNKLRQDLEKEIESLEQEHKDWLENTLSDKLKEFEAAIKAIKEGEKS